jgi:hypothetical protein
VCSPGKNVSQKDWDKLQLLFHRTR